MNASDIKQVLASLAECFDVEKERLGDLDATLGDGDHGISMASGFAKAHEAIKEKDIEVLLLHHRHHAALIVYVRVIPWGTVVSGK